MGGLRQGKFGINGHVDINCVNSLRLGAWTNGELSLVSSQGPTQSSHHGAQGRLGRAVPAGGPQGTWWRLARCCCHGNHAYLTLVSAYACSTLHPSRPQFVHDHDFSTLCKIRTSYPAMLSNMLPHHPSSPAQHPHKQVLQVILLMWLRTAINYQCVPYPPHSLFHNVLRPRNN